MVSPCFFMDNYIEYGTNFIGGCILGAICTGLKDSTSPTPLSYERILITSMIVGFGMSPLLDKIQEENISQRESFQRGAWCTLGIMTGATGVKLLELMLK
jgi:hypothetical protein